MIVIRIYRNQHRIFYLIIIFLNESSLRALNLANVLFLLSEGLWVSTSTPTDLQAAIIAILLLVVELSVTTNHIIIVFWLVLPLEILTIFVKANELRLVHSLRFLRMIHCHTRVLNRHCLQGALLLLNVRKGGFFALKLALAL